MFGQPSLHQVNHPVWNPGLGRLTPVAVAAALLCCGTLLPVWANPQGGVAIHGQATFDTSQANTLQVTTQNGAGTSHSAINWQSFSIPVGNTTNIVQPSATSLSINRVVTNTPSELFGTLRSNGQVLLVNQAGIAVGVGALVDTAGFTASAVGMTAADAAAGRLRFAGDGISNTSGALTVQGNIIARGGDVVLIAPNVEVAQTAVVDAQGGSVVLAAGQSVEVTGRGLEGITLHVQAPTDQALNLGTLKGDAVGIFAGTLRHSGVIQATQASMDGGRVVLKAASDAYVQGNGRIEAVSATGKGGRIEVLGNRVAVMDNAVLDASGATGGGTVLVGGDYQGKNAEIPNAQVSYFGANAMINADATGNGNGGKVVVWADDTTRAYGRISARGGGQGGDGGFVETSGKNFLDVGSIQVDTSAALGSVGTWLLDPTNIYIAIDQPTASAAGLSGTDVSVGATGPMLFQTGGTPTDSLLLTSTLETALVSNNVEVNTTSSGGGAGNITVSSALTWNSNKSLKLNATSDISVNSTVTGLNGTLSLVSGGSIGNNAGAGLIHVNKLEATASNTVNLVGNNQISNLAASSSSSSVSVEAAASGGLTIGSVGSTNGLSAYAGVTIKQYTAGGITVDKNVSSVMSGTVSLGVASGGGGIALANTGAVSLSGSSGVVVYTSGGAITQTNALTVSGPLTLTTNSTSGGITLANAGNDFTGTVTIDAGGAGAVSLVDSNALTLGAMPVSGPLTVTAGNGLTVGGAIAASSGDVSLTASGLDKLLTISSNVQATSGSVIYITDNLAHNAFTTTSGSAGKFVEVRPFTAATAIEFSATADAPGFLRLSSGELSFSTPMLKLGHNSNTGGISFAQAVVPTNFNTLSLITGASISQTTGSTLTIANLNADGASGVAMGTEANAVTGKLGGHTGSGNFALKTTGSVVLEQVDVNNGITSTSGNVTLDVGGSVSEGGSAVLDTPGTVTVTSATGMALNNNNSGSVAALNNLTSGDIVYVANRSSVSMSATNVGAGAINLSNVAGGGTLAISNVATSSGNVSVVAPGSVTLGTVSTSGNVAVTSSGGAIADGNSSALNLSGAVIDLTAATGIATAVDPLEVNPSSKVNAQTTAGSIYLAASGSLPIGLISAPATVSLSSMGGNIVDANGSSNNISAASAALSAYSGMGVGDALETQLGTVSATTTMTGDIVIDNTGTLTLGTLSPGGGGRWLVYAANPASVVKGSVTSNFRHYSATYSTYASPSESGNGLIYASAAPALSVATTLASGTAGNVFGASPSAVYSYTLTGFADAEDNAGNIGLGGTAAFTPSISSTTNAGAYTVNYASGLTSSSGYTFSAGTGLAYVVTASPITISTTNVSKTYDGGLSALGTATITSGSLFGSDTISGGTFAFTNKNVGAGNKTVAVTGVTVNDTNGGANYNVTYANNTTSTITAAALTVGATASSKVYDGNTTATVVLSDNRVAGDVLSTSYSTANFADSNVGAGKTVNVLGISVSGTDAGNYTYNTTATALADITAASVFSPTTILTNQVVTFSENLQTVAQEPPPADGGEKEEARDAIVVEGEVCKP